MMSLAEVRPSRAAALVSFLMATFLSAEHSNASCLPQAVPEAERQLLTFEEGSDGLPLGLWVQDWDSAWLAAAVGSLVIEEMLGFQTVYSGSSDSTMPGITALTGCELDNNQLDCPSSEIAADNPHHASLEVWLFSSVKEEVFEVVTQVRKPYFYDIGYTGIESQYVTSSVLDEAMEAEGLHLEFYGDYNSKWHEPWKYFDNLSSIPTDLLTLCSDTDLANLDEMARVMQFTPDAGGFNDDGTAYCEDGFWWRSPACRANPDWCIPFMSGGTGWLLVPTMQRSIAYNMPIAIGLWKSYYDFLEKPFELRTLTYSWEPSMHFLSLGPERVSYPPTDVSAVRNGDYRTLRPSTALSTLVMPSIATAAPRILKTLGSLSLTESDMMYLLTQYSQLGDLNEAACSWLLNHTEWQDWIPLDTACSDGEGLSDADGNFVKNRTEAVGCSSCSGGYFSVDLLDDLGATTICQQCDVGSSQPMWGSDSCELCGEGYYQDQTGQSSCVRCERGSYSTGEGNSACQSCPAGRSTDGTGYRTVDDCKCMEDSYESPSGQCVACGTGARCSGFGAEPEALAGYHLAEVRDDTLWIFSCSVHPKRCPGGPLNTCSRGREGIACSECASGYSAATDGGCNPCSTVDKLPFVFGLCCMAAGLAAVYWQSSQDTMDRNKQSTNLLLIIVFAQLVQVLQMLGVFARIAIDWPEPLMSIWQALKSLSFEILDHMQLECIVDVTSLATYLSKLAVVPILCGSLGFIHLAVCFLMHRDTWRSRSYVIANAIGIAVLAFYIAVCLMVLSPFQCYQNPNNVWTMAQSESVICWASGDHVIMVVISLLASSIPFSFLCYIVWILIQFPARTGRGDVGFLRNASFILSRVRPRCRWWICFSLCRNLAISMVPIIPTNVWQFFALVLILTVSIVGTVRDMPNASEVANWLDIIAGSLLLCVVLLSAPYLDATDAHIPQVALVLLMLLVAFFLGTFLWIILSRFFFTRRKPYRWFLCHHKVAAGSFARLLKMYLTRRVGDSHAVFLDSDDLFDLGKLFECVSRDVETLVALASRDLFERSWCLGEVTMAYICELKILPVHFADFIVPDERSVKRLPEVLHMDHLLQNNLTIQKIQEAVLSFGELAPISVPEFLDEAHFNQLAMAVYSAAPSRLPYTSPSRSSAHGSEMSSDDRRNNLVLVDNEKTEAVSAALILLRLLTLQLTSNPMMIPQILPPAGARVYPAPLGQQPVVLILFCTSGCFSSPDFLLGIMEADSSKVRHVLPVVASADFQFPTETFYQSLSSTLATMGKAEGCPIEGTELSPFIASIFRKICRQLSPLASAEVLSVQADHILRSLLNAEGLALDEERSPELQEALRELLVRKLWNPSNGQPKEETDSGTLCEI